MDPMDDDVVPNTYGSGFDIIPGFASGANAEQAIAESQQILIGSNGTTGNFGGILVTSTCLIATAIFPYRKPRKPPQPVCRQLP